MKQSTKGAAFGVWCGVVVWATTGTWQFLAVTAVGFACAWLFSPPHHPQPRGRGLVRVEIREVGKLRSWLTEPSLPGVRVYPGGEPACYDYGGCQWAGDGCKGKPVVLGPGEGCTHTGRGGLGSTVVRAPEEHGNPW